jgi:C-terminal processing protease CtpA/Prc
MPLSGGRAIKLTTSRYHTPSGRSIQGSGIEPDHVFEDIDAQPVDLDDPRARVTLATRDAGVHAALELLKGRKPRARDEGKAGGLTAMAPAWK